MGTLGPEPSNFRIRRSCCLRPHSARRKIRVPPPFNSVANYQTAVSWTAAPRRPEPLPNRERRGCSVTPAAPSRRYEKFKIPVVITQLGWPSARTSLAAHTILSRSPDPQGALERQCALWGASVADGFPKGTRFNETGKSHLTDEAGLVRLPLDILHVLCVKSYVMYVAFEPYAACIARTTIK